MGIVGVTLVAIPPFFFLFLFTVLGWVVLAVALLLSIVGWIRARTMAERRPARGGVLLVLLGLAITIGWAALIGSV